MCDSCNTSYKGWTNKKTWQLAVVLGNTEEYYLAVKDMDATELELWTDENLPTLWCQSVDFKELAGAFK